MRIQYDGHIALVEGVQVLPSMRVDFNLDKVPYYDKAGLPMTVEGDSINLYSKVAGGDDTYLVPTGLLPRLLNKPYLDRPAIKRNTHTVGPNISWTPKPTLRDYQVKAVRTCLQRKRCIISLPTGAGKSLVIEELCLALGKVLVIVPTKLLLYQMAEQLQNPGLVGDGNLDISKDITVAIPDTLYRKANDIRDWLASIPALVVDECHTFRCPTGATISSLLRGTQYRIGLSATPTMDYLLEGLLGPLAYTIKETELIALGYILAPSIKVVDVPPLVDPIPMGLYNWYMSSRGNFNPMLYRRLYSHCILNNHSRNGLIANLANEYVKQGHGPLIIVVSRVEDDIKDGKVSHASVLGQYLRAKGLQYSTISGSSSKSTREKVVGGLADGSIPLVIAGASILKEGVNIPMATGTIIAGAGRGGNDQSGYIQQVGRLLRPSPGKVQPTLYILDDDCHPLFQSQSKALIQASIRTYGESNVSRHQLGSKPLIQQLCTAPD
jgi:superfamily II DNA or RNA helicase